MFRIVSINQHHNELQPSKSLCSSPRQYYKVILPRNEDSRRRSLDAGDDE